MFKFASRKERMLRIEHLVKSCGIKMALDDLSRNILPGEIYGFIGHNGAAETTTIRSVVGIQNYDNGEIYFVTNFSLYILLFNILLFALVIGETLWLKKKGVKKFERLG